MATLMLSVMGAVAEFERSLIRERQREGIALAKQRGVYRGRSRSLRPDRLEELRSRVRSGEPKAEIARELGISRESLYRLVREAEPRPESWGPLLSSLLRVYADRGLGSKTFSWSDHRLFLAFPVTRGVCLSEELRRAR